MKDKKYVRGEYSIPNKKVKELHIVVSELLMERLRELARINAKSMSEVARCSIFEYINKESRKHKGNEIANI